MSAARGALAVLAVAGVLSSVPAGATEAPRITVTDIDGGFRVCAAGAATEPYVAGQWQLLITGARDDGSLISSAAGQPGSQFATCFNVPRGESGGAFVATLAFAGVSGVPAAVRVKPVTW